LIQHRACPIESASPVSGHVIWQSVAQKGYQQKKGAALSEKCRSFFINQFIRTKKYIAHIAQLCSTLKND